MSPSDRPEMPNGSDVLRDLRDCPYSLPDDARVFEYMQRIVGRETRLRNGVYKAQRKLVARGIGTEVGKAQYAREIHESNAIEYAGFDSLKKTAEILSSGMATRAEEALKSGMLITSITKEKKVVDVLGLNNAKILARNMVEDLRSGRHITETDIRDLHRQITAGEYHAGRYKELPNQISGATHVPTLPINTPIEMAELMSWAQNCQSLPTVLKAAVAHAWLVHIHPFEDGNGRVARVFVNMMMVRAGLPPVIIDHAADRTRYIEAIALSDEAGDILPLVETFYYVQRRFVREVDKPRYIAELVEEHVAVNNLRRYEGWQRSFHRFITALTAELAQYRLELSIAGELPPERFARIMDYERVADRWMGVVSRPRPSADAGPAGPEILLAYTSASSDIYAREEPGTVRYPAITFAMRDPTNLNDPFRMVWKWNTLSTLREIAVIPGAEPRILARYDRGRARLRWGYVDDSAAELARVIAMAARRSLSADEDN